MENQEIIKKPENRISEDNSILMGLTTDVVCAYVGNNPIAASDMSNLINDIHSALNTLAGPIIQPPAERPKPPVSIKKSLGEDYLICLEDGKPFKSLKRHLNTHYGLSPEQYRLKWGLPADYPMVAPAYAKKRSKLAKKMGLGQKRRAS